MVNKYWEKDWNDIIRYVIFEDEELKSLMKIPENTNIITFIDKYFVRAGYATNVLTNEDVRIVYGSIALDSLNPNVTRNEMSFDIYVKLEHIHDIGRDRLEMRTHAIAARLINILTDRRYMGVYRMWVTGEGERGTGTIGYARYNVSFGYMKTY